MPNGPGKIHRLVGFVFRWSILLHGTRYRKMITEFFAHNGRIELGRYVPLTRYVQRHVLQKIEPF